MCYYHSTLYSILYIYLYIYHITYIYYRSDSYSRPIIYYIYMSPGLIRLLLLLCCCWCYHFSSCCCCCDDQDGCGSLHAWPGGVFPSAWMLWCFASVAPLFAWTLCRAFSLPTEAFGLFTSLCMRVGRRMGCRSGLKAHGVLRPTRNEPDANDSETMS